MTDDPASRKPGSGDLESPFLFVPHGAPEPTEWMRKHPGWVKFPATFVPRAPAAVRTIPGTNRPWPLDKRGQPWPRSRFSPMGRIASRWPRSRFGQPLRPLDEYPPGVRAPGEGYTGPIADPAEAVRACMASKDVLARAAEYAADPDAPVRAYLSAMEVWKNPAKYAGLPRPEAMVPVRTPDASASPVAQRVAQPPDRSPRPDLPLVPAQARGSVENDPSLVQPLKNTVPRGYPAPINPFAVFVPRTPENEAWVRGAERAIGAIRDAIGPVLNDRPQDDRTSTPSDSVTEASSGNSSRSGKPTAIPRPSGADAASLPPNGPDGPDEDRLKSQTYQDAPYHGRAARGGPRGGKSAAPEDGTSALRTSFKISENAPRRIDVDTVNKQFVVLDRTHEGVWHGHVRTWDQLAQSMRSTLIRNGVTNTRGDIIAP